MLIGSTKVTTRHQDRIYQVQMQQEMLMVNFCLNRANISYVLRYGHTIQFSIQFPNDSASEGQVSQMDKSDFPMGYDTIFNFFYRSYHMIFIRLSQGNSMPTDLRTTFRFNFRHSTFMFKRCDSF